MSTLSVIIPCFNNGKFLKEMMDCCLRQTFVDWELIIVDDQSTDNTTHQLIQEYVLRDNRIKFYVRDRLPKGSVVCRNIGFDKSCGKYIIHFDADDLIPETCFERRVCFMEENPDCDYATFPTGAFYDGEPLPVWNGQAYKGVKLDNPDLLSCFLSNNYPFSCWCNIYKRSSIESLQWDEEVLIYTDFSFIVPCILAGLKHKFCDLGNYDYFYRKFKTGKNMCSSFVSDEKCYSTNRLFRLTIEEIKKLPNSEKYLEDFKGLIILHFERLLLEGNVNKINDFISIFENIYPSNYVNKLKRSANMSLSNIPMKLHETWVYFTLFFNFPKKTYWVFFTHALGKFILNRN